MKEVVRSYADTIPYVNNGAPAIFPCTDPSYATSRILRPVACLAARYRLLVAFNLPGIVSCSPVSDNGCSAAGLTVVNTVAAISGRGQFVARAFKTKIGHDELFFSPPPLEAISTPVFFSVDAGAFLPLPAYMCVQCAIAICCVSP